MRDAPSPDEPPGKIPDGHAGAAIGYWNAVSVAGTLLLTEATLTERKEEREEVSQPAEVY